MGEFVRTGQGGDRRWESPVATPADLPAIGAPGDVRQVVDDGDGKPAQYAWDTTAGAWRKQADPDTTGGAPSGPAGGDLGGLYPNPTVNDGADGTAVHVDTASEILGITGKASPTGADVMLIEDSAAGYAKKSVLLSQLPTGGDTNTVVGSNGITNVGTNVDADLAPTYGSTANTITEGNDPRLSDARTPTGAAGGDLGGTYPNPTVNDGADGTAIHDDTAGEIAAITAKTTPSVNDVLVIEDSTAGNAKKSVLVQNITTGGVENLALNDVTGAEPSHQEGLLYYANGAFNAYIDEPNVTLQVGQEFFVKVRNATGVAISDGSVVYVNGAVGQNPTIALADASAVSSSFTLGVTTHSIANNGDGYVTTNGRVNGIDTTGTPVGETWLDGDEVYLSPTTPGGLTKVKPTSPNIVVTVGTVLNAAVNGALLVTITEPTAINDLNEVNVSGVTDGDGLFYNGTIWTNSQPSRTGNLLWVDSVYGDNATAVAERANRPYLTIAAAIAAASAGDTIILRPGVYPEDNLTLPSNVVLRSEGGWTVTEVGSNASTNDVLTVLDSSQVEGIAFRVPAGAGLAAVRYVGGGGPTTFSIYNCNFYGDAATGLGDGLVKSGSGKIIGAEIRGDIGGMNALLRVSAGVIALESIHVPPGTGTINAVAYSEGLGAFPASGRFQLVDLNVGNPNVTDAIYIDGNSSVLVFGINTFNCQNSIHVVSDGISAEILGGKMDQAGFSVLVDPLLTGAGSVFRITANHQPDYSYPPAVTGADFGLSFFQEATDTRDSLQRTFGTDVQHGFPERGSGLVSGEGGAYSTGMVVFTTDGTASPSSDGANFVDESATAASKSGSTFGFQGSTAGHSILFTSARSDPNGDRLRFFSLDIVQDVATVLGGGSYVFEVQSAANTWVEVGAMALSKAESYRYANSVFLRASSSEVVHFEIDGTTTWPETTINGVLGRWCRVRIATTVTTAPTFERWRLGTNNTEFNVRGQRISNGLAMWKKTVEVSSVQWSGNSLVDGDLPIGSGGDAYTTEFETAKLNSTADIAYGTFQLPSGICTAHPITVEALYCYEPGALAGAVTIEGRVTPAMVQGNTVADLTGGITPVSRAVADTRLTTVDAPNVFSQLAPSATASMVYKASFGPTSIEEFYEGDLIFIRFQMTNDGGGSDINLIGLSVSGVGFTEGALRE